MERESDVLTDIEGAGWFSVLIPQIQKTACFSVMTKPE